MFRDIQIGSPLEKGISGGQAKRTNIGIALITNPRVIFLDEPTSGLDSFTANEVRALAPDPFAQPCVVDFPNSALNGSAVTLL